MESIIDIMIAHPSDVEAEALAAYEIISELSVVYRRSHGASLAPFRWKENARPGMGESVQGVVDAQTPDYKFLVVIFGTRIGTPSGGKISGTISEYESALERQKQGLDVDILLYFSEKPINPFGLDVEQLSAVKLFRQNLEANDNTLFEVFESLEDFKSKFRQQLQLALADRAKKVSAREKLKDSAKKSATFDGGRSVRSSSGAELLKSKLAHLRLDTAKRPDDPPPSVEGLKQNVLDFSVRVRDIRSYFELNSIEAVPYEKWTQKLDYFYGDARRFIRLISNACEAVSKQVVTMEGEDRELIVSKLERLYEALDLLGLRVARAIGDIAEPKEYETLMSKLADHRRLLDDAIVILRG